MQTPSDQELADALDTLTNMGVKPRAPEAALLHFYRCRECLGVITTRETITQFKDEKGITRRFSRCSCCPEGGAYDYMGRVVRENRLGIDTQAPPCDARCTNAGGPNCNCQCSCLNHGTQRLVDVVVDGGPVPRLVSPCPQNAAEYLAAKLDLVRAFENTSKRTEILWIMQRAVGKASKMRTHKGRIDVLRKATDRLKAFALPSLLGSA